MQLHPRDMGAAFFEVDWDEEADMTGNWHPAGGKGWRDAVATEIVSDIVAVELQGEKPEHVYTLNGSALALPRVVAALLETHQGEDGSVSLPEPLHRYVGADRLGP